MRTNITCAAATSLNSLKTDCLVIFFSPQQKISRTLTTLSKKTQLLVNTAIDNHDIKVALSSSVLLICPTESFKRILLISTGKTTDLTLDKWLLCVQTASTQLAKLNIKTASIEARAINLCSAQKATDLFRHASCQLTQFNYKYNKSFGTHKKSRTSPFSSLKTISFLADKTEKSAIQKSIKQGFSTGIGINAAKELGNLPGNICTPSFLASQAKKLAKNPKISVKILNEKQMKALGMHSLLSVSAGSTQQAKLIILEYKGGPKTQKPITLVGKGITFDSGGISLKPGGGMDEMKFDMCGAASVMGVFNSLNELNLKQNITGVIAAAENMPSGIATKPGDVITSMSGQTIEVLNTDAEGRLVLCDALTYTQKFHKPKLIIDLATLTGACVVALGSHATGLYSNCDDLAQDLLEAGEKSHDRAWRMPLWQDYHKQLKSNFADLANIGGREAGSVTAACFLENFIDDKTRWAHMDIAGVAWKKGGAKGATGRPVSLLMEYLLNQ